MSKYIIEIPDDVRYVLLNGKADNKYYTAVRPIADLEELNNDYINEHYGELQDEAYKQGYADAERIWRAPSSDNEFYQKGLEDAWKAAMRIVVDTDHGGLALGTLSEIFGTQSYSYIMRENTVQQAIDKIKTYEDKPSDRIEVGDIVDVYGNLGVVTYMYDELKACVMMVEDGSSGDWNLNELKKTGKHYDIASILEAMRNTH